MQGNDRVMWMGDVDREIWLENLDQQIRISECGSVNVDQKIQGIEL